VIAEGIEDRATADFLLSLGCEDGQGYFFGRPMTVADLEARFVLALQPSKAEEALDAGQAA
jgi:EAL domain-containing protein (putative c-di-GMP-specific phosphodiesterase class I)